MMSRQRPFALTHLRLRRLFEGATSGILTERQRVEGRSRYVTVMRLRGRALQELGALCTIDRPAAPFATAGIPSLRLRLRGPDGDTAFLSFIDHEVLCVDGASSDAFLKDGEALARWLAARGIGGLLAKAKADRRRDQEQEESETRWLEAMPVELAPLRARLMSDDGPYPVARALARLHGSRSEDAATRALLAWYGSGRGPWSGYFSYEEAPEQMLLRVNLGGLLAALRGARQDAVWVGAARLLSGGDFARRRRAERAQVPAALVARMRERVKASGHRDNLAFFDNAFAPVRPPALLEGASLQAFGPIPGAQTRGLALGRRFVYTVDGGVLTRISRRANHSQPLLDTRVLYANELVRCGNELVFEARGPGDSRVLKALHVVSKKTRIIAREQTSVRTLTAHGDRVIWLDRSVEKGFRIQQAHLRPGHVETLASCAHGSLLGVDETSVIMAIGEAENQRFGREWMLTLLNRGSIVRRDDGGESTTLASLAGPSASWFPPRLSCLAGQQAIVWDEGKKALLRIPVRGGRPRLLCRLDGESLTQLRGHGAAVVALLDRYKDGGKSWTRLLWIPLSGEKPTVLARLPRGGSDALVVDQEAAWFTYNEWVLRCPLPTTSRR